jgi:hypothetical protein
MKKYEITINPVTSALAAQESFRRRHTKKPDVLRCSPESYRNLIIAAGMDIPLRGEDRVFNGSVLVVDDQVVDFEGEFHPSVPTKRGV